MVYGIACLPYANPCVNNCGSTVSIVSRDQSTIINHGVVETWITILSGIQRIECVLAVVNGFTVNHREGICQFFVYVSAVACSGVTATRWIVSSFMSGLTLILTVKDIAGKGSVIVFTIIIGQIGISCITGLEYDVESETWFGFTVQIFTSNKEIIGS